MSQRIKRLTIEEMEPALAKELRPRYERLGYLGEFFRCAGHLPEATIAFSRFTETAKKGISNKQAELVALTVATMLENQYERNQHERLSVRSGFGRDWVAAVEELSPAAALTDPAEKAIQTYVLAAVRTYGQRAQAEFEAVVDAVGPVGAVSVMLVMGRYLAHAVFSNTLRFSAPVPSIFEDGFSG